MWGGVINQRVKVEAVTRFAMISASCMHSMQNVDASMPRDGKMPLERKWINGLTIRRG